MDMRKVNGLLKLFFYFVIFAFLLIVVLEACIGFFNLISPFGCSLVTTLVKIKG